MPGISRSEPTTSRRSSDHKLVERDDSTYRRFVESVSRIGENEIERALKAG